MPVNVQIVAALEAHPAAPDQECIPGQMTILAQRIAQLLSVVSVTSEIDQQSTNSIAQQALETANIALTTAQQAIASIPQIRSGGPPLPVVAGDSVFPITWSIPMPSTNYLVIGNFYGANSAAAQAYAFRIVDSSRTVNGCTLRLDNVPSGSSFAWVAQQLF